MSNASVTDPAEIQKGIKRAEFVKKEIEALYVWACSFISLLRVYYIPTYLSSAFFFSEFQYRQKYISTIPTNGLLKALPYLMH